MKINEKTAFQINIYFDATERKRLFEANSAKNDPAHLECIETKRKNSIYLKKVKKRKAETVNILQQGFQRYLGRWHKSCYLR